MWSHHGLHADLWVWKINVYWLKKKKGKERKKLPVTPCCVYTCGSILAAQGCPWVDLTFININRAQRTLCLDKAQSQELQVTKHLGQQSHSMFKDLQTDSKEVLGQAKYDKIKTHLQSSFIYNSGVA